MQCTEQVTLEQVGLITCYYTIWTLTVQNFPQTIQLQDCTTVPQANGHYLLMIQIQYKLVANKAWLTFNKRTRFFSKGLCPACIYLHLPGLNHRVYPPGTPWPGHLPASPSSSCSSTGHPAVTWIEWRSEWRWGCVCVCVCLCVCVCCQFHHVINWDLSEKNPAYRTYWISRPMRIVSPLPWRKKKNNYGPKKNVEEKRKKIGGLNCF